MQEVNFIAGSHASLVEFKQLVEKCDRFESAWKNGIEPALGDYVVGLDARTQKEYLAELIILDLQYRWRRTESANPGLPSRSSQDATAVAGGLPPRPHLEDYLAAFPELGPPNTLPDPLIEEEYRVRHRWGDQPSISEYLQRFPDRTELFQALSQKETISKASDESHPARFRSARICCPYCDTAITDVTQNLQQVRCPGCRRQIDLASDESSLVAQFAGRSIGHFVAIQQIGLGGFGEVWKAQDTRLDREVAIKFPRRRSLESAEIEQFLREARTAAQLSHPHIVTVYEVGLSEGIIYIVSDFIEGEPLSAWSLRVKPTIQQVAKLCIKIASAIHHAHQLGVIHRDLKPQNILIDERDEPHITDFGLAKREVDEVTMTLQGQILGTPAYMSPEQARGDAYQSDRRSDVYSLGVILYELLTGERPFRGSLTMLMHQVIHDEPLSPRRLSSVVPRDLETICLKCLQKLPTLRYATAQIFADDLQRFIDGHPIAARPIGRIERGRRWILRNPVNAGLIATVLLVGAIGLATTSWQLRKALRADRARVIADVRSLATADSSVIPEKLSNLDLTNQEVVGALRQLSRDDDSLTRLRAYVALLPIDLSLTTPVYDQLFQLELHEFVAIRRVLESYLQGSDVKLRQAIHSKAAPAAVLANDKSPGKQRLMAAACVRDQEVIESRAEYLARELLHRTIGNPASIRYYFELFESAPTSLIDALKQVFSEESSPRPQRYYSALYLAEFLKEDIPALAALTVAATPAQFPPLIQVLMANEEVAINGHFSRLLSGWLKPSEFAPAHNHGDLPTLTNGEFLSDKQAARLANAAIGLLYLGDFEYALDLLQHAPDPSVRSHLIDRLAKLEVPPRLLLEQLAQEQRPDVCAALLLALSCYEHGVIGSLTSELTVVAQSAYQTGSDAEVHAAARLLLTCLGYQGEAMRPGKANASHGEPPSQKWKTNSQFVTMVELSIPSTINADHQAHRYSISSTEITLDQLEAHAESWLKESWPYQPTKRGRECPAMMVTWSEAAEYCNWLSKQERMPESHWCYESTGTKDNNHPLLVAKPNATALLGYRLPTVQEWEHACGGGCNTTRFFGEGSGLLSVYSWWGMSTGDGQVRPVATKLPNQFGLFDMYGNVIEWCHETPPGRPTIRRLRGLGAGDLEPDRTRPTPPGDAALHSNRNVAGGIGFRVAKTLE